MTIRMVAVDCPDGCGLVEPVVEYRPFAEVVCPGCGAGLTGSRADANTRGSEAQASPSSFMPGGASHAHRGASPGIGGTR